MKQWKGSAHNRRMGTKLILGVLKGIQDTIY
jgi:hypothetical protein